MICSCSWTSCCRDSCSCCLWNSAISSCLWSCCLCLRATSSCCSCCSGWSVGDFQDFLIRMSQDMTTATRDHPHLLMTEPRPGSADVGQAVEVGVVGWGWETRPNVGCWWWWWWSTMRRSMGRVAVAAGGTCMGSAAVLTSTGRADQKSGTSTGSLYKTCSNNVFTMQIPTLKAKRSNSTCYRSTHTQSSLFLQKLNENAMNHMCSAAFYRLPTICRDITAKYRLLCTTICMTVP